MNLTSLRILESVSRTGSFQGAARELHCAQSTVNFHARELEQYFNCVLFERLGRGVRLSARAEEILPLVSDALAAHARLEQCRQASQVLEGTVTMGTSESLSACKLMPVFRKFRAEAPGVTLMVENMTAYGLRERVLEGTMDLAVTFNCNDYAAPLTTLPLDTFQLVLLGSPELSLPAKAFFQPGMKLGVSIVSTSLNNGPYRYFSRFAGRLGLRLNPPMQAAGLEAVRSLLLGGLGVAYMPRFCFEKEIRQGTLREIPTALGYIDLGVLLLKNARKAETAATGLLSRIIRAELSNPGLDRQDFFERTCLTRRREN